MIKLFSLKQEKEAEKAKDGAEGSGEKKAPGLLRMQKDMSELDLTKASGVRLVCDKDDKGDNDLMNFTLTIEPDEGFYKRGKFEFKINVPNSYPHDPPKVLCKTRIYHPNIDMEGHVCLNILREDWKPVLTIQSVIFGMVFLMTEPNPDDPLNKEAANALKESRSGFQEKVKLTLKGQPMTVGTTRYSDFPKFFS